MSTDHLDVTEDLLRERARIGADMLDEVWDGVLHMNPQPSMRHQRLSADLMFVMTTVAKDLGLLTWFETPLFDPVAGQSNYRIPDLMVSKPELTFEQGYDTKAELVVEILSPNDESYKKFGFYAARGVAEFLIIDPFTRMVELWVLDDGDYRLVEPDETGAVTVSLLDLTLCPIEGPGLRLTWHGGESVI